MFKRKRSIGLVLALALLAPLSFISASPAHADNQGYTEVKIFLGNNPCLDVNLQDRTTVEAWSCNGGDNQMWQAVLIDLFNDNPYGLGTYEIFNKLDGKCLTDTLGTNARLQVQTCTGGANQRWWNVADNNFTGIGWSAMMQNALSQGCMVTRNYGSANGTAVITIPPGNVTGCGDIGVWFTHMLI